MKKRSLVAGFVIVAAAAAIAFPAAAFAQTPAPAPSGAPSQDTQPGPDAQNRPNRPGGDNQGPGFRGGSGSGPGGQGGPGYGFGYGGPGGGYGGNSGPGAFAARRSRQTVSPLAAALLTLLGLGLLAGAGALGYRLGLQRGRGGGDNAKVLLDSRYARGEIDSEDYQQRRVDLAGAH